MKKIIAVISLCLVLCMLFASCASVSTNSGSNATNGTPSTNNTDGTNGGGSGDGNGGGGNNGGGNGGGPTHANYTREGDKIYFGSYPQTQVSDATLVSTLNTKAGTLPAKGAPAAWTEYGYFVATTNQRNYEYMWYIDVTEGGNAYRGVYFTDYRPFRQDKDTNNTGNVSNVDDNGYTKSNVYWFKYEPIAWTVLSEAGGKALIACELILDSQTFSNTYSNQSNYELSTIRAWLNSTFYDTAFNTTEKQYVAKTTVNNSVEGNDYACGNTEDYVFLLSREEAKNKEYFADNAARKKTSTDYAKAQGLKAETDGTSRWWLRTPSNAIASGCITNTGATYNSETTYFVELGIVPAITFIL